MTSHFSIVEDGDPIVDSQFCTSRKDLVTGILSVNPDQAGWPLTGNKRWLSCSRHTRRPACAAYFCPTSRAALAACLA